MSHIIPIAMDSCSCLSEQVEILHPIPSIVTACSFTFVQGYDHNIFIHLEVQLLMTVHGISEDDLSSKRSSEPLPLVPDPGVKLPS